MENRHYKENDLYYHDWYEEIKISKSGYMDGTKVKIDNCPKLESKLPNLEKGKDESRLLHSIIPI